MVIKLNGETLIKLFIVYVPISIYLTDIRGLSIAGYGDEIFTLLMFFYIFFLFCKGKLLSEDGKILMALSIMIVLGFLGNIFSHLSNNYFAILVDAFWQIKIVMCFLGAKYIAQRNNNHRIFWGIDWLCKLFLWTGAICGIISCFTDIGMSNGIKRYGLPSYYFIIGNEGRYGIITAVVLLIVLFNNYKMTETKKRTYTVLALIGMILTTKGIVYIIIAVYIILLLMFKYVNRKQKITIGSILPIIAIVAIVGSYQISTYFMNNQAPRMLLITYGFITAMTYFPFGAGFALYGSEMAARYYSPLYVKYGWKYSYAMGIDREGGSALNDNYLATIVGEIGIFGLILYIYILIKIFLQINNVQINKNLKSLTLSLFICMIAAFVATGIMKSSTGVFCYVVFGVLCGLGEKQIF